MKIKLDISEHLIEKVKNFFEERDIETGDDGEYRLVENNENTSHIMVRKIVNGDKIMIDVNEIIYIESFGHQIEVVTKDGTFITNMPLYQISEILDKRLFSRISKSVLISKRNIKTIIPSISMKFTLIMKNDKKLVVTRSYYEMFKKEFNI